MLAFAFAEGTGNDWISLATIDHHHVAPALGTLVFAVFLGAMTTARWFGPTALDRYGRVPVVRVSPPWPSPGSSCSCSRPAWG